MKRGTTSADSPPQPRVSRSPAPERRARAFSTESIDLRTANLLSELIDCLAGIGEYASQGLQTASRIDRFAGALESLEADERFELVGLLVSSALGRLEATRWYARDSLALLLGLCDGGCTDALMAWRAELEGALENATRPGQALRQRLSQPPPRGRAFLRTWMYTAQLWQVITALHSPHSSRLLTALLRLRDDRTIRSNPCPAPSRPPCWWMPRTLAW